MLDMDKHYSVKRKSSWGHLEISHLNIDYQTEVSELAEKNIKTYQILYHFCKDWSTTTYLILLIHVCKHKYQLIYDYHKEVFPQAPQHVTITASIMNSSFNTTVLEGFKSDERQKWFHNGVSPVFQAGSQPTNALMYLCWPTVLPGSLVVLRNLLRRRSSSHSQVSEVAEFWERCSE